MEMEADELLIFRDVMVRNKLIVAYSGYVTEQVLVAIGGALKQALAADDADFDTVRRVFSVFVEQVQNIIRYSAERHSITKDSGSQPSELSYGIVAIGSSDSMFFVSCGNLVLNEDVPNLQKILDEVQKLNKTELRALYREKIRSQPPPESKGAGLGLIEVARRASRPVTYAFKKMDETHTFFCVKAFI
jgi:hypothetical protein